MTANSNNAHNLKGKTLVIYKNNLPDFTQEQKDILIGTLLGDATMGLRSEKPLYGVKFEQKAEREGYIRHLYSVFEQYTASEPSWRTKLIDGNMIRTAIWFRTVRHDKFIFYFNYFYKIEIKDAKKQSIKSVPHTLKKLLTARAVAYWFMDDGTYHIDSKSGGINYLFSTQGFTKAENDKLVTIMKENFNINAAVHKDVDKWRLYINKESTDKLRNLISPYIHPDFIYKLDPLI